ncbi:MAG: HAMP domain-containing histidine kinase [Paenibacillaceae bacterium]|nr:HAMP domain-containing histidine kinase [Paenibacillaceae bacterium]
MLRNREFRQFTILFTFMTAITVILGFAINTAAGVLAVASSAAFGTVFIVFTKARYENIARISNEIDLILHNADHLYIGELDEGELSILHSEIGKMTLRIREQNEVLKKEKKHLADSLADIAHQLKTPLTSVNLILSLLANNPDEDQRKVLLREMDELLVRMDWLITTLLKLSRLDAGIIVFQREPIDVNALIRGVLQPFLIQMELHHIELQTDVPKGLFIQGDLNWLSQALQNILKNCLESTGEMGKLQINSTDNPLFTEILIRDSGNGFKEEDLPRIFDRFYQGKNQNASGYGIGLSLCQMIIAGHSGTITAKNHPQGGAVFTIRFPK